MDKAANFSIRTGTLVLTPSHYSANIPKAKTPGFVSHACFPISFLPGDRVSLSFRQLFPYLIPYGTISSQISPRNRHVAHTTHLLGSLLKFLN